MILRNRYHVNDNTRKHTIYLLKICFCTLFIPILYVLALVHFVCHTIINCNFMKYLRKSKNSAHSLFVICSFSFIQLNNQNFISFLNEDTFELVASQDILRFLNRFNSREYKRNGNRRKIDHEIYIYVRFSIASYSDVQFIPFLYISF